MCGVMDCMEELAICCAFTGHRDRKLPWGDDESDPRCLALKQGMYDAAEALVSGAGVRHFICGMARGADLYFCEAVLALRSEHPELTLEAAIPCEEQSQGWPEALRRRYDRLVSECDYVTVISKSFTPDCMLLRNRYMVDRCGYLIAAYNGSPGGTRATLLYALRQGRQIIQLPMEDSKA